MSLKHRSKSSLRTLLNLTHHSYIFNTHIYIFYFILTINEEVKHLQSDDLDDRNYTDLFNGSLCSTCR